jgi:hypothetical protein
MSTTLTPRRPSGGFQPAQRCMRIAVVLAGLAAATLPAVAATPAEQAADDLNAAVLKTYRQAKAVRLAQTSPVIIVAFDQLIMIRNGDERRLDFTPRSYDNFKEMSHTVMGFYGAAALGMAAPTSDWAVEFRSLRERAGAMLPKLAALGLAGDRLDRGTRLLSEGIAFADRMIAAGAVTQAETADYARRMAPLILANAADAAVAQIDGLHALVRQFRSEITDEEWKRLYVVVLGCGCRATATCNSNISSMRWERGRSTTGCSMPRALPT